MLAAFLLALVGLTGNGDRDLPSPRMEMDIRQQALENPDLVEGDMLISHNISLGNAIRDPDFRWDGYPGRATVPYEIEYTLTSQKDLIEKAMKHYEDNTCVKFRRKRRQDKYWVNIFRGWGCFAAVGRDRNREQPQPLSLGNGCHNIGTIIHELGHVLGFYHEQNRSDRDKFVEIYLDNVENGHKHNFRKMEPKEEKIINYFDYNSIMIYGNYAFSKDPGRLKTMVAKNGQELLEPYDKKEMTDSDIERVNKLYKCPGFDRD